MSVANPSLQFVAAGYGNHPSTMMKITVTMTTVTVVAVGCSATVEDVGIDSAVLFPAASLRTSWDKSNLAVDSVHEENGSSMEAGSTLDTGYVVGSVVAASKDHKNPETMPLVEAVVVAGDIVVRDDGSKNSSVVDNSAARPFVDAAAMVEAVAVAAAVAVADLSQGSDCAAVPKTFAVLPGTMLT